MDEFKITQFEIDNNNVKSAANSLRGDPQDNKNVFDRLPELIAGKFNNFVEYAKKLMDKTGVEPRSYGGFESGGRTFNIPIVTVDEYGRITDASESKIGFADNENFGLILPQDYQKIHEEPPVKSVNDMTGDVKIEIPTKTSQLQNDSGYAEQDWVAVNYQPKGDYATTEQLWFVDDKTLANAHNIEALRVYVNEEIVPTLEQDIAEAEAKIPTKTSQIENDSGYLTAEDIPDLPSGDDGNDGFSVYKSSAEAVSNGPRYYKVDIADIDTNDRELQIGDLIITPSGKMYSIFAFFADSLTVNLEFYTSIKGNDGLSVFKATANPSYSDSTGYYIARVNVDSVDRTVQTGDFILSPDGKLYRVISNTDTRVYNLELYLGLKAEFTEADKAELTEDVAQKLVEDGTIPTKTSQLDNDSDFAQKSDIPTSLPASDVYSWAKQPNKPSYSKSDVGLGNVDNVKQYSANNPPPYPVISVNGQGGAVEVEPKGTAQTKVTNHNADDEAHNDIRLLLSALTKKVNDLLDSDDTTLDQMSEVVAYIKANRELLESYTTEKVNVADIIDNLTTSVSNKPLSAKQGVQLKALIDAIKVPTKLSELSGDSTHRTVTDSEKAAWDAKSDFSGEYGDLKNKPTKVTDFTNDAGYQTAQQVQNYAQPKGNYITEADLQAATDNALAQAKASGEFDGEDGKSVGFNAPSVTTLSANSDATASVTKSSKTGANGEVLYDISFGIPKGPQGPAYTLTEADKNTIVAAVKASLPKETWTFELEDGSTVTKAVYIG